MRRASLQRLVVLGVLFLGLQIGSGSTLLASPTGRASALTADERATLIQYAKDTWCSFQSMVLPSGLPADSLSREGASWSGPCMQTTPTDIAAYLWSVLAAERLDLIGAPEARSRLDRTLTTLEGMGRTNGFFLNDLDPRTGATLKLSPIDSSARRPFLSSVDNAWLAVALVMVANAQPLLRDRAERLLEPMDFRFFYDPFEAADPEGHPGQLRVGYWVDDHSFYGHYGLINTEARIASYLGIARGQLPPEHYYRMYRTLPEHLGPQHQSPRGEPREYYGIKVFEGSYDYRGARIVPSWGGSMFEALMVTLFVPEDVWAPRSWGINHPLYVQAQIKYGMEEAGYGCWGFSPASSPRGGYEVYGVKAIGTSSEGYRSYEVGPPVPPRLTPDATGSAHGVVTPYAAFLALRYAPHEAIANLRLLSKSFPIYSPFGFQDSADISTGVISGCILTLDQGMIMAAIANELVDDAMQHLFSDGPIEQAIRPLIAVERFSAGLPGHLAEQPADQRRHRPGLAAGGIADRPDRQRPLAVSQHQLQAPQVVAVEGLVEDQHDRPAGPAGEDRPGQLRPGRLGVEAVVGQGPLEPPLGRRRGGVPRRHRGELTAVAVSGQGHDEAEVGQGLGLVGTNPTFVS